MTNNFKFEEIQKFGKQQLEAATAASSVVAKGLQEIAGQTSDYSRKTIASGSDVVEKFMGARSFETAIQIQSEFAKSSYESFVAQATKINEIYVKIAGEVFKPMTTAFAAVQAK